MHRAQSFIQAAVAALILIGSIPEALAQSGDTRALADRIERLERDLLTLQRQVYRGQVGGGSGPPAPGAPTVSTEGLGRFETRVSALEDQMRDMTGRLEETQFQISQLKDRLDKLASDIDFRLGQIEQGKGGQAGQAQAGGAPPQAGTGPAANAGPPTPGQAQRQASPPPAASGAGNLGTLSQGQLTANAPTPPATPPAGTPPPARGPAPNPPATAILPDGPPSQQYQFAFNILAQNDYDQAERAFRAFLQQHPNDNLAPDALYWLASIYFVRTPPRYEEAAQLYAEAYQKFPTANRAPATLSRLGISLARLNKTKEACVAFKRFDEQFPNAAANLKSQVASEKQKANCK